MKPKKFEEPLESVREGGAIREQTSLSQSESALLIGISVKTIQNWEQARHQSTGPAATLLRINGTDAQPAMNVIHRT